MIAEINPSKLSGNLTAVSSKSYAHRIIIASALADRETTVKIKGFSDDIIATLNAVKSIGGNYQINGDKVVITPISKNTDNVYINCNESGTTARIIVPICASLH